MTNNDNDKVIALKHAIELGRAEIIEAQKRVSALERILSEENGTDARKSDPRVYLRDPRGQYAGSYSVGSTLTDAYHERAKANSRRYYANLTDEEKAARREKAKLYRLKNHDKITRRRRARERRVKLALEEFNRKQAAGNFGALVTDIIAETPKQPPSEQP